MSSTQRPDPSAESASDSEVQWTKLEVAFTVGIVGCLLFATWQLGDLLARDWLDGWVGGQCTPGRSHLLRRRLHGGHWRPRGGNPLGVFHGAVWANGGPLYALVRGATAD